MPYHVSTLKDAAAAFGITYSNLKSTLRDHPHAWSAKSELGYSLTEAIPWFITTVWIKRNKVQVESLLQLDQPASERDAALFSPSDQKRLLEVERLRLANAVQRGELIYAPDVEQTLQTVADTLKRYAELARRVSPECQKLFHEALDAMQEIILRQDAEDAE